MRAETRGWCGNNRGLFERFVRARHALRTSLRTRSEVAYFQGVGSRGSASNDFPPAKGPSEQGDQIDFDTHIFRKPRYLDRRARGLVRGEIARVDFVHRGKLPHIDQEDGRFDDALERGSRRLDDRLEIFEDALGLRRDVSFDHLLRFGIERDLPGEKNKTVGANRLRIGTDGLRTSIG